MDTFRNEEVCVITEIERIFVSTVYQRRLRWLDHVEKMDEFHMFQPSQHSLIHCTHKYPIEVNSES